VLEQERARLYYPPSAFYTSSGQRGPLDRPVAALSLMRCDVVDRLTCRYDEGLSSRSTTGAHALRS
jgi:hypothetical protein